MDKLIQGIARFKAKGYQERKNLFQKLATAQSPEVLFITCSDSRIDPCLITQTDPGDLFICRNAGNIVPPHAMTTGGVTASIEFAVEFLNVKDVIVCGHTDCGVMKGAMNPELIQNMPHVTNWMSHCAAARARVIARCGAASEEHTPEMIRENVILQLKHLETHPSVASKLVMGELQLHGWIYDIAAGEISCYDKRTDQFVPIEEFFA